MGCMINYHHKSCLPPRYNTLIIFLCTRSKRDISNLIIRARFIDIFFFFRFEIKRFVSNRFFFFLFWHDRLITFFFLFWPTSIAPRFNLEILRVVSKTNKSNSNRVRSRDHKGCRRWKNTSSQIQLFDTFLILAPVHAREYTPHQSSSRFSR